MVRRISWVKAALKDFGRFPTSMQDQTMVALRIAARGEKSDAAKPMKGFGSGVFEIALRHRDDAYRAIYAVQLGDDVWVLHAFQKKSKSGIKTPQRDTVLIRERMRALKERLR